MEQNNTTVERLIEKIKSLFEGKDDWQVVTESGHAEGFDGLVGVRLTVNCLYEEFAKKSPPEKPRSLKAEAANKRRRKIKKALNMLASESGLWFVACYRLTDSSKWCMAWSDHLPPWDAAQVVRNQVKISTELWADDPRGA